MKGISFGGVRIRDLLLADHVVLMASSGRDLQLSLKQFAAKCVAVERGITICKSETLLQVGDELPLHVEEFKYLGE